MLFFNLNGGSLPTMFLIPIMYSCTGSGLSHPTFKEAGEGTLGIMENEFECLVVRWGHSCHFAEKFVKKYCS